MAAAPPRHRIVLPRPSVLLLLPRPSSMLLLLCLWSLLSLAGAAFVEISDTNMGSGSCRLEAIDGYLNASCPYKSVEAEALSRQVQALEASDAMKSSQIAQLQLQLNATLSAQASQLAQLQSQLTVTQASLAALVGGSSCAAAVVAQPNAPGMIYFVSGVEVMCDAEGYMKVLHYNPSQEDGDATGTIGQGNDWFETMATHGSASNLSAAYVSPLLYTHQIGTSYLLDSSYNVKVHSSLPRLSTPLSTAIVTSTDLVLWVPACTNCTEPNLRTELRFRSSGTSDSQFADGDLRLELHITRGSGYCNPCQGAISNPCTSNLYQPTLDEGYFSMDSNTISSGGCRVYGHPLYPNVGTDTRYELWVK